jgi:hypothetical protein
MGTYFTINLFSLGASFLDRKDRKGFAKNAKGFSYCSFQCCMGSKGVFFASFAVNLAPFAFL